MSIVNGADGLLFAAVASAGLSLISHWACEAKEKDVQNLQQAYVPKSLDELVQNVQNNPYGEIPYVAVRGRVASEEPNHEIDHDGHRSILFLRTTLTEHTAKWNERKRQWEDSEHEIRRTDQSVPFGLVTNVKFTQPQAHDGRKETLKGPFVRITGPVDDKAMQTVFHEYSPIHGGKTLGSNTSTGRARERDHHAARIATEVTGYMIGERLKGFEETQRAIRTGDTLTVIGTAYAAHSGLGTKIARSQIAGSSKTAVNHIVSIGAPESGLSWYISRKTLNEIIADERSSTRILRWLSRGLGLLGLVMLAVYLRRWWRQRAEAEEIRRWREELEARAERRRQEQQEGLDGSDADDTSSFVVGECVVCQERPRAMLLLECAHFCACDHCAERLVTCPVCRMTVSRRLKIYHP
eukprot:Clim_evm45s253 gene=Clim_evmTU45s253